VALRLKSVLCAAAVLLSGVSVAHAQSAPPGAEPGGIGFGVVGGPLLSSLSSEVPTDEFATKTGWVAGAFADTNRADRFGAIVELLYARKGANDATSSASLTIDYLEVPLLLRVKAVSLGPGGPTVYGMAGPTVGVRLRAKLDSGDSLTDEIAKADVGLAVGAGAEWRRLLIEARYTKGLRDIGTAELDLGGALKTHGFAILAGWRFK
jgi:hypothetical protein